MYDVHSHLNGSMNGNFISSLFKPSLIFFPPLSICNIPDGKAIKLDINCTLQEGVLGFFLLWNGQTNEKLANKMYIRWIKWVFSIIWMYLDNCTTWRKYLVGWIGVYFSKPRVCSIENPLCQYMNLRVTYPWNEFKLIEW